VRRFTIEDSTFAVGVKARTGNEPGKKDPGDQPWTAEPSPFGMALEKEWNELPR